MEWMHEILAVVIYIKVIILIYYVLKYLSFLQNREFGKSKQEKVKNS